MGLGSSRNSSIGSNRKSNDRRKDKSTVGIVFKVILDVDDPLLDAKQIPEIEKAKYIGAIQYRLQSSNEKNEKKLPIAIPYNSNFSSLPLKNEVVRIITVDGAGLQYERVVTSATPNVSCDSNIISKSTTKDKGPTAAKGSDYSKVQQTGVSRSTQKDTGNTDNYGEYFNAEVGIHKLRVFEGDTFIESRFGQSIRFSGYNNPDKQLYPTITIRNGENGESLSTPAGKVTEEDINKDDNIIFLGSRDYVLPYTLPTNNEHISFANYPSELKGNQIVLNSDRVILSAKASEMIFASKGDFGIITDSLFSIDSTGGIDVTLDDDTNYKTNDRNINFNTGNGKVNIGDVNLESLVRGETLVDLMSQLISAIEQQVFLTPSGPSATGPVNKPTFSKIKSQLNTMLSTLNKTS